MSTDRPVHLFGAGGHGRVVAAQVARFLCRPVVFGDANPSENGPDIGFSDPSEVTSDLYVTIGNNDVRKAIHERAQSLIGPALIMNEQSVFSQDIGIGSQILHGAVINPGATIGQGTIINTSAIVEHDVEVGAFSHIAPGSVLGGNARIGNHVLIGSNATVLPGVKVADNCIIGAGAVVQRDAVEAGVYVGVPAIRMS